LALGCVRVYSWHRRLALIVDIAMGTPITGSNSIRNLSLSREGEVRNLHAGRIFMKVHRLLAATAAVILGLTGSVAFAQGHTQFDQHDQQVTRDWYNQHQAHAPAGLRNQDRLSADEESRLQEGRVLDKNLRRKVYSAPRDLSRQLPPPPSNHRYVVIGGHVGLIDNHYQVKSVIHLHDNR
jgi:Ni/Co efflux regulator RcnB